MGIIRDRIDDVHSRSHNNTNNLREDLEVLTRAELYIDELIQACSGDLTNIKKSTDSNLQNRLVVEYNRIVADLGDINESINRLEYELPIIGRIIPKVIKHISEGYLDFDEYEDTDK